MDKKVYYFKPRIIGFIFSIIFIVLMIILVTSKVLEIMVALPFLLFLLIYGFYPEIMIILFRVPGLIINSDSIIVRDFLLREFKYFFVEGEQMTFEIKNGSDYGFGYFLNSRGKRRKVRLIDDYKEPLTIILLNINESIKNHFHASERKE